MLYPWLEQTQQQLVKSVNANRFHHGQLFYGLPGVGKQVMVEQLANALLCLQPNSLTPCGQCKSCYLNQANTHPDKRVISVEGQSIGVDEIRSVSDFMSQSAAQNGAKVVVINDCHKMTTAAANALLKTLEEPSQRRYLLLTTSELAQLPATILSRCAKTDIVVKSPELATTWLGSIIDSQQYPWLDLFYAQPLLVSHWQNNDLLETVDKLYKFATSLKDSHNFSSLASILSKQPALTSVFILFLNAHLKAQLLNGLSFDAYQNIQLAVTEFLQNSTQVLGLNLSLAISRLAYSLQKNIN